MSFFSLLLQRIVGYSFFQKTTISYQHLVLSCCNKMFIQIFYYKKSRYHSRFYFFFFLCVCGNEPYDLLRNHHRFLEKYFHSTFLGVQVGEGYISSSMYDTTSINVGFIPLPQVLDSEPLITNALLGTIPDTRRFFLYFGLLPPNLMWR